MTLVRVIGRGTRTVDFLARVLSTYTGFKVVRMSLWWRNMNARPMAGEISVGDREYEIAQVTEL